MSDVSFLFTEDDLLSRPRSEPDAASFNSLLFEGVSESLPVSLLVCPSVKVSSGIPASSESKACAAAVHTHTCKHICQQLRAGVEHNPW